MDRPRLNAKPASVKPAKKAPVEADVGNYFASPSRDIRFINSGCEVLNCVLGGGYPLGRIVNIVGDKSTGKTLLAIEAAANFFAQYEGHVWYVETEAAFDDRYAAALGLPVQRVLRPKRRVRTVEDLYEHIEAVCQVKDKPGLYIVDSFDALSDNAELDRPIGDNSFGAAKAKKSSEMFRRMVGNVEDSKVCLMIISQIRDNIGVTFGRKYTRSGGKALDFYASQAIYLAQMGQIKKTINKIEKTIGLKLRVKAEKNKIGLPLRECEMPIRFGFGVDDVTANLEWLDTVDSLDAVPAMAGRNLKLVLRKLETMPVEEYELLRKESRKAVRRVWSEVETKFLPTRQKQHTA